MTATFRLIRRIDETLEVRPDNTVTLGEVLLRADYDTCVRKMHEWGEIDSNGSYTFVSKNRIFEPILRLRTRKDALPLSLVYIPLPGEYAKPVNVAYALDDRWYEIRQIYVPADTEYLILLYLVGVETPLPLLSATYEVLFRLSGLDPLK